MTAQRRILVVDDETIIASFLKQLLAAGRSTFEVATAKSGVQAIAKIREFRPHIVVLDINIPDGDGFWVCEQIRNDPTCKHTIVLGMTSDPTPDRVRRMLQLGARECLFKPFSLQDFAAKVEKYCNEATEPEPDRPVDAGVNSISA